MPIDAGHGRARDLGSWVLVANQAQAITSDNTSTIKSLTIEHQRLTQAGTRWHTFRRGFGLLTQCHAGAGLSLLLAAAGTDHQKTAPV